MSDKPVWMETWSLHTWPAEPEYVDDDGMLREAKPESHSIVTPGESRYPLVPGMIVVGRLAGEDRTELAAAAPQLVRALLAVEWSGPFTYSQSQFKEIVTVSWRTASCSGCEGNRIDGHSSTCALNAALTAAGFDTQEKRDEARRVMGEGEK